MQDKEQTQSFLQNSALDSKDVEGINLPSIQKRELIEKLRECDVPVLASPAACG